MFEEEFRLLHALQTDFGAHSNFQPMGSGALSSGVWKLLREADRLIPATTKVKKTSIYTYTNPIRLKDVVLN
jgi:hypothetical protein